MRLDSHGFSPAILGKIIRAAARSTSFDDAAEALTDGAGVAISGRQLGRIAHEFGEQLRQDRDRRVDDFAKKKAAPEAPVVPRLAAVYVDGGRLHTRSEAPGKGPGVHDAGWREDKIANLVTMSTKTHDVDPHPDLPECFTKKKEVVELVQGIAGQGALADVVEGRDKESPALTVFKPDEEDAGSTGEGTSTTSGNKTKSKRDWPPEPLVRTCVATLESSDEFGPMVAAEASRRNFFAAQSRAFIGDGGSWIWTLHRTFFPKFEPIVDFVHVLTYIYVTAKAVGGSATVVWKRYLDWATACWQGRVATVLEEMRAIHEAMPPPENPKAVKDNDPYEVIRVTIGYLTNNEARMDYPRYRCAGLPTCSGLVESLVKQFNRRVKGTEKFWNPTQAETILQLRAAYLCDDERLAKHMKSREISAYRTYKTTRKRKAG